MLWPAWATVVHQYSICLASAWQMSYSPALFKQTRKRRRRKRKKRRRRRRRAVWLFLRPIIDLLLKWFLYIVSLPLSPYSTLELSLYDEGLYTPHTVLEGSKGSKRIYRGMCVLSPVHSKLSLACQVANKWNRVLGAFWGHRAARGLQLRGTRAVNSIGPTEGDDRQRRVVEAGNSIKMYECIHGRARSREIEWKSEASSCGVVGQPEKPKQRTPGLESIEGFQERHGNPQIWKRESSYLDPFSFPWVNDGWAICHGLSVKQQLTGYIIIHGSPVLRLPHLYLPHV